MGDDTTSSGPDGAFDRRHLMKLTGIAALSAALTDMLPGSFLLRVARAETPGAQVPNATVHLGSVAAGAQYQVVKEKIRAALMATRDLSIIKAGELVVIKVVSNSPYKYPMVTHPWALQAVLEIVKERSQNVRVVDQVGFEHCFYQGETKLNQATKELWMKFAPKLFISRDEQVESGMEALNRNGLKAVAESGGAQVLTGDHDRDYIHVPNEDPQYGKADDPEFAHWTPWKDIEGEEHPRGFRVNRYALGWSADEPSRPPSRPPHMISISRLSAHVWTGTTGPTKAYFGWLHPQDRVHSHTDINPVSTNDFPGHITGAKLNLPHPEMRVQSERITEVALFFQRYFARVRANTYYANLIVALDTYSDVGPDWGVVPLPNGGVIGASDDVIALDAVSSALLMDYMRKTPEEERAAPAKATKKAEAPPWWKFWEKKSDKYWNAVQELNYRATRGEWNTLFGAAPWLFQLDKDNADPSVWKLGQVDRGAQLGYANNLDVKLLDPGATLSADQQKMLARAATTASQPSGPGINEALGAIEGGNR